MDVHVDGRCVGCGLCVNLCSPIFTLLAEGVAAARDEVAPEYYDQVREAAESCPVSAIVIKE